MKVLQWPSVPRVHVLHVPGVDFVRDASVEELRKVVNACVHEDPDRNGVVWNWLGALECAIANDVEQPWTLIIQDDLQPLDGWLEHLPFACHYSPEPFLSLTCLGGWGEKPHKEGVPYAVGDYLLWGAAVAYHRSVVADLWEWASRVYGETGYPHDDVLVACYAMGHGYRTAMVTRALFGLPKVRSLLGHHLHAGRSPSYNIVRVDGPFYSAKPRWIEMARPIDDKMRELAKL